MPNVQGKIKGKFLVKDPDNLFELDDMEPNGICVFPLDELENVTPANKSYVEIDDNQYIVNIIEKKIISRYFCTGGYFFADADTYLTFFTRLANQENLYMSHIIYAMLLNKIPFRPVHVRSYVDLGTQKNWQLYKQQFATLYMDELLVEDNLELIHTLSASDFYKIVVTSSVHNAAFLEQEFRDRIPDLHAMVGNIYTGNQLVITNVEQLQKLIR